MAAGVTGIFSNSAKGGIFLVSNSSEETLTGAFSLAYDLAEITEGTVTVLY